MQRVRLVTGAKKILAQIEAWLASWNSGEYDKLLFDSYTVATGYLGRDCGNQNAEQLHRKILNLFLGGKLRQAVRFICEQETGGVLQPGKLELDWNRKK